MCIQTEFSLLIYCYFVVILQFSTKQQKTKILWDVEHQLVRLYTVKSVRFLFGYDSHNNNDTICATLLFFINENLRCLHKEALAHMSLQWMDIHSNSTYTHIRAVIDAIERIRCSVERQ